MSNWSVAYKTIKIVYSKFLSSHPVTKERIRNSNKWIRIQSSLKKEKKTIVLFNELKK
jgi:predicted Zn-dependent protease